MKVARSVAEVLSEHVTLEVECIDRLYLNLYIPILQREAGVGHFWIMGEKWTIEIPWPPDGDGPITEPVTCRAVEADDGSGGGGCENARFTVHVHVHPGTLTLDDILRFLDHVAFDPVRHARKARVHEIWPPEAAS